MKAALALLAILVLAAAPLQAQDRSHDPKVLSFTISGSVLTLGDPFGPDGFSVIPGYGGKGPFGGLRAQGLYVYQPIVDGQMVCVGGQTALRMNGSGDVLLLLATPGPTGTLLPGPDPGTFTWQQTWTGTLGGGTGRFAGATGTFTKALSGLVTLPGFVSPWEGTLEIRLDRK
jgi:hypothetical protein